MPLLVLPDVFNPTLFLTTPFFAAALDSGLFPRDCRVLEIGTGSGALALAAARRGARVTAVDINGEAVRCTRINALLNRLEERVEVLEGDLFVPVTGRRFDVVLTNPPFFRGVPRDRWDLAWRSEDFLERFTASVGDHLEADGQILVLLSSVAPTAPLFAGCAAAHLAVEAVRRLKMASETLTIYRLRSAR